MLSSVNVLTFATPLSLACLISYGDFHHSFPSADGRRVACTVWFAYVFYAFTDFFVKLRSLYLRNIMKIKASPLVVVW